MVIHLLNEQILMDFSDFSVDRLKPSDTTGEMSCRELGAIRILSFLEPLSQPDLYDE